MGVTIVHKDASMQLVAIDDLFVERWTAPGGPTQLRILIDEHGRWCRARAPAKSLFLVHIATERLTVPDAAAREMIDEHVRTIDDHIQATALVIGVQGFAAAMFRATVSAATLIRRSKYPHRVFAETTEALPWLVRQRPSRGDAYALANAYAEVERDLR